MKSTSFSCCSECPRFVTGACRGGCVTNPSATLVNPPLTLSVPPLSHLAIIMCFVMHNIAICVPC